MCITTVCKTLIAVRKYLRLLADIFSKNLSIRISILKTGRWQISMRKRKLVEGGCIFILIMLTGRFYKIYIKNTTPSHVHHGCKFIHILRFMTLSRTLNSVKLWISSKQIRPNKSLRNSLQNCFWAGHL